MDEDEGEGEQGRGQHGARRRHRGRVVENKCKMMSKYVRGHPYMTSALRGGGGVSPKEDVVREVA